MTDGDGLFYSVLTLVACFAIYKFAKWVASL